MHRTSGRFWNLFARLPESVQKVARKNFELLKDDPLASFAAFQEGGKPVVRESRDQSSRSSIGGWCGLYLGLDRSP
jgi:hypothetical protein